MLRASLSSLEILCGSSSLAGAWSPNDGSRIVYIRVADGALVVVSLRDGPERKLAQGRYLRETNWLYSE